MEEYITKIMSKLQAFITALLTQRTNGNIRVKVTGQLDDHDESTGNLILSIRIDQKINGYHLADQRHKIDEAVLSIFKILMVSAEDGYIKHQKMSKEQKSEGLLYILYLIDAEAIDSIGRYIPDSKTYAKIFSDYDA
jgi:hypothetical protein